MQALFVHGMGRTPLSGARMLRRLRARGMRTHSFGYATPIERFDAIRDRLVRRLAALAANGEYVAIGHSLGGVLLRAAIAALPAGVARPRRLFLLGSPVRASRLARKLHRTWLFRLLAGDCGQLLASTGRMAGIDGCDVPTTAIIGVKGWRGRWSPFGTLDNDGIVSVDEVAAGWADETIRVPLVHTWLPADRRVADRILATLARRDGSA